MTTEEFDAFVDARRLGDGLWAVSDDTIIKELGDIYYNFPKEIEAFHKKHSDMVIASAYETHQTLLLSKRPTKWKGKLIGSGFNYGSTNLIENPPTRLLILAEND